MRLKLDKQKSFQENIAQWSIDLTPLDNRSFQVDKALPRDCAELFNQFVEYLSGACEAGALAAIKSKV